MISSRADFLFLSDLDSELEDASFLLADAAALRTLAPPTELHRDDNSVRGTLLSNQILDPTNLPTRSLPGFRGAGTQVESNCREQRKMLHYLLLCYIIIIIDII